MCGEELNGVPNLLSQQGSPPHVRGRAPCQLVFANREGITPAYAGKRTRRCDALRLNKDHPRVCGEESNAQSPQISRMGSPPRMRGRVIEIEEETTVGRITPAYAGKRKSL